MFVVFHVTDGVNMYHPGHESHNNHHGSGEVIHQKADLHVNTANRTPHVGCDIIHIAIQYDVLKHIQRQQKRNTDASNGDAMCGFTRNAEQPGDDRTD